MFEEWDNLVQEYAALQGTAERPVLRALAARINAIYDIRVQIHNFWVLPQLWCKPLRVPPMYEAPQSAEVSHH